MRHHGHHFSREAFRHHAARHGFHPGGRGMGGFGGRGGGPEGFGGGRGGGRVFDHGDLRLVVLALIGEAPRHGYEIIKAIEERVAGSYSPSPGVIYPTLTMLQDLGQVTSEEQGGKKRYTISEEGRRYLEANKPAVEAVLARMAEVHARHGGGVAPQILRAMENLKMALRLRLSQGPLDEKQLQAVTTALDAAAQNIERS